MELDINKLLDLNNLNELIDKYNAEISRLKDSIVDLVSFEQIKALSLDGVVKLFEQYNIDCSNIIQYIESDFIDETWEFADLFLDDIKYSNELKDSIETNALKEVDSLNDKIKQDNDDVNSQILEIEEKISIINIFVKILDVNEFVVSKDIAIIYDIVMGLSCSDEDKFLFSNKLAMLLIAKNKDLYSIREKNDTDTVDFEKQLDEVYDTSVDDGFLEEKLQEDTYSETIIGYYDFYKKLIDEVGLGSNLDEVMEVSSTIASGVESMIHSINKEDFCIEIGALLSRLHSMQGKGNVNQDEMSDVLMDLAILDRIYNENEKNIDECEELLGKVISDLDLIYLIPRELLNNSFVNKIINVLKIIKVELEHNLIDNEGLRILNGKYKELGSKLGKIQSIIKMIDILNEINDGLVMLMKSQYLFQEDEKRVSQVYDLQGRVLLLIDKIKANGYKPEYEKETKELNEEFIKYTKKEDVKEEKTVLKGFVLFDFDENFIPYVINDLDVNNRNSLIDDSIPQKKMSSGFDDYSKLVHDLLIYGKPELIANSTSQVYYMSRIVSNVCYDEAQTRSTGMVRIRPLRSSLVRFMTKEVVLSPNTEIYRQVTNMIREMLPNVSIDLDKEFSIFINFASSLKITDTDSYSEAIHRIDRRSPLYKLFLVPSGKTKLTDGECDLLKDVLLLSLNAYKELENRNKDLKFDFISQIGGRRSRG